MPFVSWRGWIATKCRVSMYPSQVFAHLLKSKAYSLFCFFVFIDPMREEVLYHQGNIGVELRTHSPCLWSCDLPWSNIQNASGGGKPSAPRGAWFLSSCKCHNLDLQEHVYNAGLQTLGRLLSFRRTSCWESPRTLFLAPSLLCHCIQVIKKKAERHSTVTPSMASWGCSLGFQE